LPIFACQLHSDTKYILHFVERIQRPNERTPALHSERPTFSSRLGKCHRVRMEHPDPASKQSASPVWMCIQY